MPRNRRLEKAVSFRVRAAGAKLLAGELQGLA